MPILGIDIETYSEVDLPKCGVYAYAEHPSFEILLFAYAFDDEETQVVDLKCGERLPPRVLDALTDPAITKTAFNAAFERTCIGRCLGKRLDAAQWQCTAVQSAMLALPLSLEGVGEVLDIRRKKLREGGDLVRYFSLPCKPTKANGQRTRNLPEHAPEKWQRFKEYCVRDVEAEREIRAKLRDYPIPAKEQALYQLDQEINDRGIMVDPVLVARAIECDEQYREKTTRRAYELTGLANPNSPAQLKDWLGTQGAEVETLDKKAVNALIPDAEGDVLEVLKLRLLMAKTSVKKYEAIRRSICSDGRVHGLLQFYGANRTGRWAGRLVQIQNLPQNHIPDLALARELVKAGRYEDIELLYDSTPGVLSELIRTAFVPRPGCRFIVADFSAIEARVIAWLANEQWRLEVFEQGGDIYCQSASAMFGVPVEKHGINAHLRQKGKIAELACIAEGQQVLTDHGLIPIERVTTDHKVWDGESWVSHEGVVERGEREVITYGGLTATPDHLVWIEGQSQPVRFDAAAASGAHLVQTGNGRTALRLGHDPIAAKALEQQLEPLLRPDKVCRMRFHSMAGVRSPSTRDQQGLSTMFTAQEDSPVVGAQAHRSKTALREPACAFLQKLWRAWNSIRVCERNRSGPLSHPDLWPSEPRNGDRQNRQQRQLCQGKSALCNAPGKQSQQADDGFDPFRSKPLALRADSRDTQTFAGNDAGRDHTGCGKGSDRKAEELATHPGTARVYDLRNAGRHHRFTVSGKLVHNCGYGGSVGALTAMGALEMGIQEEELAPLVRQWRQANPRIIRLWTQVENAAVMAVRQRTRVRLGRLTFQSRSGMLLITLPSGRKLCYVKPRIQTNRFGGDGLTYEGVGESKKWTRIETFGGKLTENIVQATARDLLAEAMLRLRDAGFEIVMHVHDEAVLEVPVGQSSVGEVCARMAEAPEWADGLPLRADGYECEFYQKD